MLAKEAQKLIGTRVRAWTAMNGVYVGELIEVFGRPWRGKVRVLATLEPASLVEPRLRRHQRRGFRPGDEIEVGGANISPTEAEGGSYLEALERDAEQLRAWLSGPRVEWWMESNLRHREAQIAAEKSGCGVSEPCSNPEVTR